MRSRHRRAARHAGDAVRSTLPGAEDEGGDGEELQIGQRSRRCGCSEPFHEVKILADGTVQSCSYGLRGGFNVNAMPLEAIWNAEWYRARCACG